MFVNLVDNAIFWLTDKRPPRKIILDSDLSGFLVSDNGPGVPLRDRDAVFERGFTRKPYGRGLGLYIARDVLKRIGYEIRLLQSGPYEGATFWIGKAEKTNDGT